MKPQANTNISTKKKFLTSRAAGILAHITSLPSPHGIGDIGLSSNAFLDFLQNANQRYWQILPFHPTHPAFDHSPYMSSSAFAGSPVLICGISLMQEYFTDRQPPPQSPSFSPYFVEFEKVVPFKKQLLQEAFSVFIANRDPLFKEFLANNSWLHDYSLFMACKEHYENAPWNQWPERLARRSAEALTEHQEKLQKKITYYQFEQYIFQKQWDALHSEASKREIQLIGDVPIYTAFDSADVWANQEIFTIDQETLKPIYVSGVPPDYFSKTGQRWGNPLYRWNSPDAATQARLMQWWENRFSRMFQLVDIIRIDHFRGFESYWSIPEESETAVDGKWLKGPGKNFFAALERKLGTLPIIAEDLGIITQEVETLRDDLGFPGMKVLQFAFDGNPDNTFLPHNFTTSHCIVYTGTHDNDTTVGWFLDDQLSDVNRDFIKRICNHHLLDQIRIHEDLIFLAYSSISKLAVIPLQDILGFGNDCRMNTPGVAQGNWKWRCAPEYLSHELARHVSNQTEIFSRNPPKNNKNF